MLILGVKTIYIHIHYIANKIRCISKSYTLSGSEIANQKKKIEL